MNGISTSVRIVVTVIVLTAAILLSLAVFGALEFNELGENLLKLAAVGGIAIVAGLVVSLVNKN